MVVLNKIIFQLVKSDGVQLQCPAVISKINNFSLFYILIKEQKLVWAKFQKEISLVISPAMVRYSITRLKIIYLIKRIARVIIMIAINYYWYTLENYVLN